MLCVFVCAQMLHACECVHIKWEESYPLEENIVNEIDIGGMPQNSRLFVFTHRLVAQAQRHLDEWRHTNVPKALAR